MPHSISSDASSSPQPSFIERAKGKVGDGLQTAKNCLNHKTVSKVLNKSAQGAEKAAKIAVRCFAAIGAFFGCVLLGCVVGLPGIGLAAGFFAAYWAWMQFERAQRALPPSDTSERIQQVAERKLPPPKPLKPTHPMGWSKIQRRWSQAIDALPAAERQKLPSSDKLKQYYSLAVRKVYEAKQWQSVHKNQEQLTKLIVFELRSQQTLGDSGFKVDSKDKQKEFLKALDLVFQKYRECESEDLKREWEIASDSLTDAEKRKIPSESEALFLQAVAFLKHKDQWLPLESLKTDQAKGQLQLLKQEMMKEKVAMHGDLEEKIIPFHDEEALLDALLEKMLQRSRAV